MSIDSPFKRAASDYLRRGWAAIPVQPNKKPYVAWEVYQKRRPTEQELAQWGKQYPRANVGLVMGAVSGLVAVDCDDQAAIDYFEAMNPPPTLTVQTARGKHYYFAYAGSDIGNAKPFAGLHIDVRGQGGYLVAPPSVHETGVIYRFEDENVPVATLPDHLATLFNSKPSSKVEAPVAGRNTGNVASDGQGQPLIERLVGKFFQAPQGNRNNELNKAAYTGHGMAAAGRLDGAELERELRSAAAVKGLTDKEIEATLASARKAGTARPLLGTGSNRRREKQNTSPLPAAQVTQQDRLSADLPDDFLKQCLQNGERGDSDVMAALFRDRLKYDCLERAWYRFDGHHWQGDRRNATPNLIRAGIAQYEKLVRRCNDQQIELAKQKKDKSEEHKQLGETRDAALKGISGLNTRKRSQNVLQFLSEHPKVTLTGDEWDTDPYLLGIANGVIDLKTGDLLSGEPADYIRTVAPAEYKGLEAAAPLWQAFLAELFPDTTVQTFLQRLFGAGISGVALPYLPVLCGKGRNGKDTLIETLAAVLGDHAHAVGQDVFLSPGTRGGGATPHLMQLQGKRLIWANETHENAPLNSAQVKYITGGGMINARAVYGKQHITFAPTHLACLITNYPPLVNPEDYAVWQRLVLIEFNLSFVEAPDPENPNERQVDPELKNKLKAESSGILAWLVRGCLEWQEHGLNIPETVKLATQAYQRRQDGFEEWHEECCAAVEDAKTLSSTLYNSYKTYTKDRSLAVLNPNKFSLRLKAKGYEKARHGQGIVYLGLTLAESL